MVDLVIQQSESKDLLASILMQAKNGKEKKTINKHAFW